MRESQYSILILLASLLTGCDFGSVTTFDLPQPAALDIQLTLIPEDEDIGALLGWSEGVPGAEVRLIAADTSAVWSRTAMSDASGRAQFENVPVGTYHAQISRMLTAEERAAARAAGIIALVEHTGLSVRSSDTEYAIHVPASRTRSLVISEVRSHADLFSAGTCCYTSSSYIEVYNNADTVIYLDGKVVGRGFSPLEDLSPNRPCSMFENLRMTHRGIWTGEFEMFPGNGQQYPLPPGHAAVIARDAIDHRPFAPTGLDLSGADFEFFGNADVDNPAVPNMINIGLRTTDRGLRLFSGILFLAESVVTSSLDRAREPDTGREWALVPADRVLDVAVQLETDSEFPLCPTVIHSMFDRRWVHTTTMQDVGLALQRRSLLVVEGGRVVLQHTRTSFSDFVIGPGTPGTMRTP